MAQLFSVLVVVTVVLTVGSLGLVLGPGRLARVARDRRVLLGALLANVVIVPALAWVVASGLPLSAEQSTGVVLVAVGAGGALGIKVVQLSGWGDPALALALVLVLELTDVVAVPVWVRLVAPEALADPRGPLASVALMVLLPLVAGAAVARSAPTRAARLAPRLAAAATAGLAAVLATGVLAYASELRHELASWVMPAAALVALMAIGVGAGIGRMSTGAPGDTGGLAGPDVRGGTVAMVTSARFSSLGLVVVDRTFAAAAGVHGPAVVTALVLLVVSVGYAIVVRARRRRRAAGAARRRVGGRTVTGRR